MMHSYIKQMMHSQMNQMMRSQMKQMMHLPVKQMVHNRNFNLMGSYNKLLPYITCVYTLNNIYR